MFGIKHVEMREQVVFLEHITDVALVGRDETVAVLPHGIADANGSAAMAIKPRDGAQQT